MKSTIPIVLLAITFGFAAGWFANNKDEPNAEQQVSSQSKPAAHTPAKPSGKSGSSARSNRTKVSKKSSSDESPMFSKISPERLKKMKEKQDEFMRNHYNKKHEARIKKLVATLGLNAEQEKQLRAYFAKKTDELVKSANSFGRDKSGVAKAGTIDAELAGILDADQKEAYEELKTRERKSKIESNALTKLASIQRTLDLTDDQKDKVYQILLEDAGKKVDSGFSSDNIITAALGVETGDAIGSWMGVPEFAAKGGQNQEEIMKRLKEAQQKKIDDQVARLAPVLDEEQQKQYRESLQGGGWLGGMLGGAFSGSVDGSPGVIIDSSVVPAPEAGEEK